MFLLKQSNTYLIICGCWKQNHHRDHRHHHQHHHQYHRHRQQRHHCHHHHYDCPILLQLPLWLGTLWLGPYGFPCLLACFTKRERTEVFYIIYMAFYCMYVCMYVPHPHLCHQHFKWMHICSVYIYCMYIRIRPMNFNISKYKTGINTILCSRFEVYVCMYKHVWM